MRVYKPDNWVVLKINDGGSTFGNGGTFYKVLAGWSGGYTSGDSWRINSGITEMREDEDYYYFYSASGRVIEEDENVSYPTSGSCYQCHKETQFLRPNIAHIFDQLNEHFCDTIELMPPSTDYSKVEW